MLAPPNSVAICIFSQKPEMGAIQTWRSSLSHSKSLAEWESANGGAEQHIYPSLQSTIQVDDVCEYFAKVRVGTGEGPPNE